MSWRLLKLERRSGDEERGNEKKRGRRDIYSDGRQETEYLVSQGALRRALTRIADLTGDLMTACL